MPTPLTYSFTFPASLTGNALVDSLIAGKFWLGSDWNPFGATNLSYSFMAPGTSYFATNYSPKNEYNALYELTTAQKTSIIGALGAWSAVANINFTLTSDNLGTVGDLRFGGYRLMDNKTAAWAYFPDNLPAAGDVWIGMATDDPNPVKGTYDYLTFVHEIGHALGLKHPFDTSAANKQLLDPSFDDVHFTVMSYNSNYSYQPTTPMVLDIIAMQSLYGANMLWQTGDNIYKWDANQSVFETIWDAGGNDTIDGSNQLAAVNINLNEGAYSQIGKAFTDLTNNTLVNDGLGIAIGAKIENAIGSAFNDKLTGNDLNNTLNGMAGADTMIGGAGNDTYYVDNIGDVVVETGTSLTEIDRVFASIDYTLGANVENVLLTGTANLNGTGNELNNRMTGNAGNNILDGKAGADTMIGGAGDDTYIVDNAGDIVTELSGEGHDLVKSSVSYTLSANVEDGQLFGSGVLDLTGNDLNNVLTGTDGVNTLNGGLGADTMIGGAGNDTYYVDNIGDVVVETGTSLTEIDRVFASIDYTLGANVENVLLTGTANLNGTGNELNNRMTGNDGNNTLDGKAGADTMIGGAGNDTYYVDNIGDVVVETGTSLTEIDRVFASIDYTLGANVENVLLIGTANLNGTGNELNNRMTGNAGNNILDGKAGADTMIGGAGDDTYIVDNAGDIVTELSGEGHDLVKSSVSYTLSANVEDGQLFGSGVLDLTGNDLNNVLTGTDGVNTLNGGLGADTMIGGAGNDTYYVDNIGDVVVETGTSLTEIDRVFASIDYTLGANVENVLLTGTANLNGTGNELNNRMTGNDGNNTLDGKAGADTMIGGAGNDTYYVDNIGDVVVETGTSLTEIDRVFASIDYTLGANVENVLLIGTANLNGTGNELNNRMTGNAGNNILDGKAGADTMIGGAGDDTYIVDNAGDIVTELSGEGHDLVKSSVSYTLSANVEDGQLFGSGVLDLTGNDLNNVLTGTDGVNTLNGGLGADTMIGGAGNDTYYVDNIGDVVVETGTSLTEIDRVFASIDYTLGANVENVLLTGTANLNGTGNELNNRMTGNDGNNTLDGKAGADTMIGGAGNDTYYVDNIGDVVVETGTSLTEIDRVFASIDYTLGANVENVLLTGTANLNGTGNELNNRMTGNAGNNILDGKAGADTMIGGAGDDTYIVDNAGDIVTELSGEGHDLVKSSVSYTLSANVEDGQLFGSGVLDLTGNDLNNVLTGTDGVNTLNGGLGADTMIGGAGNDTYYVDNIGDVVVETGTSLTEIDRVFASIDYTLGANVENVLLTGTANLNGTGNELNNRMTGNDGNNTLDGGLGADTMIGGLGNDTYIVDNAGDTVIETSTLAGEIDTVRSSVNWTLGDNLENLELTGNSNLNGTGNALNNRMTGNAGNNILDGKAGADTMIGGAGDDTYIVDNAGDIVTELSGEGHDLVKSSVSYTLSANVEDGQLFGSGVLDLTGNDLNNVLTGTDGVNTLNGGLGADTMIGGAGNDTYYVDNIGDVVVETGTSLTEIDRVFASIDYTLGANVENVLLTGTANLNGTGNELNNRMTGNAGNNILDGKAGADTMIGGAGDDTYIVDNAGDIVTELSGEGHDLVKSSVSYTLSANVEDGQLFGSGVLDLTGNDLNNVLTGTDGVNTLNGGLGADTMIGGAGNDTYYVDNIGDVVVETGTSLTEIDRVFASIDYTLGANVENVLLTGTANLNGTGNELNNRMTGNDGNNTLDGGLGADTMIGGLGNDTYIVDNAGDTVIETSTVASEIDTVRASVNWTLGDNLENLVLTGSSNLNGTGNALNNTLTGNDGNNLLNGGAGNDILIGGLGTDTLTGGSGADTFVFNAWIETGTGNLRDVITDFNSAQGDKIDLTKFDANLLTAGFNGFTFIGAGDFTGAGQVRFVDHVLSGNVSGNAGADFEIQLVGVNSFSANDLVA